VPRIHVLAAHQNGEQALRHVWKTMTNRASEGLPRGFRQAGGPGRVSRSLNATVPYPAAIACFTDDLDALLARHHMPVRHRIRVRTTNLAERSFVEERRRTKVIPRSPDENAAMKLVFATLIRAADRWCRVSISDLERRQLTLLRTELGLDPPPATTVNRKTNRRKDIAA
jgi:transposase-like protein